MNYEKIITMAIIGLVAHFISQEAAMWTFALILWSKIDDLNQKV